MTTTEAVARDVRNIFKKSMAFNFEQYQAKTKYSWVTKENLDAAVHAGLIDQVAQPMDGFYLWRTELGGKRSFVMGGGFGGGGEGQFKKS